MKTAKFPRAKSLVVCLKEWIAIINEFADTESKLTATDQNGTSQPVNVMHSFNSSV